MYLIVFAVAFFTSQLWFPLRHAMLCPAVPCLRSRPSGRRLLAIRGPPPLSSTQALQKHNKWTKRNEKNVGRCWKMLEDVGRLQNGERCWKNSLKSMKIHGIMCLGLKNCWLNQKQTWRIKHPVKSTNFHKLVAASELAWFPLRLQSHVEPQPTATRPTRLPDFGFGLSVYKTPCLHSSKKLQDAPRFQWQLDNPKISKVLILSSLSSLSLSLKCLN